MQANTPWIRCRDGSAPDPYMLECERCGTKQKTELPISVTAFVAATQAFVRRHSACRAGDA